MSTFVIASSEGLMNTLRDSVLQSQQPLHRVVQRPPGQALLPWLQGIEAVREAVQPFAPEAVAAHAGSHTGHYLRRLLTLPQAA